MYGESILTQKGKKITDFSNDLKKLYQDMLDTMYREEGIGLAAQQVGLALQFCVIDVPSHPEFPITCVLDGNSISPQLLMPMVLINPTIKFLPSDEYYYDQGIDFTFFVYNFLPVGRRKKYNPKFECPI